MQEARVLVVDDSAAMRALFSDLLDQAKNVVVVGTAANADEARQQIVDLKPNVLTLDVEMPGMSGIEFLEEVMETKPMPVVMLSSLTQSGTEISLKAYELGAVECFPKPLKATPEQFSKTVGQLGKIVLAAANSNVKDAGARKKIVEKVAAATAAYSWNGHVLALSASMGGIDALTELFSSFPADCPATAVVLGAEPMVVDAFINRMSNQLPCEIRKAVDGAALTQGVIHVAADPALHMVIEAGAPPKVRLVNRDPVDGARPSATLMYGTMARAGVAAVGVVMTGMGEDGAKGLKMLRDSGAATFAQDPASATVAEAPAAAVAAGGVQEQVALDKLAPALLAKCSATGTYDMG